MMLAAVETVTNADPVWESRRHNSDVAAQATARESVHVASPLKSSGRNVYNEPSRASMKDAPAFSTVGSTKKSGSKLKAYEFLPIIRRMPHHAPLRRMQ
jgi:hypothetical protein